MLEFYNGGGGSVKKKKKQFNTIASFLQQLLFANEITHCRSGERATHCLTPKRVTPVLLEGVMRMIVWA